MLDLPAIGRKSFKGTRLPPRRAFRPGTFPFELIKNLQDEYPELAQHAETAGLLDQYYVPTRYPTPFPMVFLTRFLATNKQKKHWRGWRP